MTEATSFVDGASWRAFGPALAFKSSPGQVAGDKRRQTIPSESSARSRRAELEGDDPLPSIPETRLRGCPPGIGIDSLVKAECWIRPQRNPMDPNPHARTRKRRIRVTILLTMMVAGFLVLPRFWEAISGPPDPVYSGHRVSWWFRQLSSGTNGEPPLGTGFAVAYEAFARMDSDAVPFLTRQLASDPSGTRTRAINFLRRYPRLRPLIGHLSYPPEVREFASLALRRMGPRAESALPVLLDVWGRDQFDNRHEALLTVAAVLGEQSPKRYTRSQFEAFQERLLAEAVRRAQRLGYEVESPVPPSVLPESAKSVGPTVPFRPVPSKNLPEPP